MVSDMSIEPVRKTVTVEVEQDLFEYVQKHAEPLVDDFSSTLRRLLFPDEPDPFPPKPEPKQNDRQTSQLEFMSPILYALIEMGGSGRAAEVRELVYKKMKKKLTDRDHTQDNSGSVRWRRAFGWAIYRLSKEDLLSRPAHGVWQITPKGRRYLMTNS